MQSRGMNDKPYRKRSIKYIQRGTTKYLPFPIISVTTVLCVALVLSMFSALYAGVRRKHSAPSIQRNLPVSPLRTLVTNTEVSATNQRSNDEDINVNGDHGPSIRSLQDLTPSELHPQAGPHRHIVNPPLDELPVTLVACTTTVGYLHILVHPSWAPLGAERFLHMVNSNYFSSKVALMRCIKNFLCQFGIAGIPSYNKPYNGKGNLLIDDRNWLPEGPTHRKNALGVKRFSKGYLAYAGGGKNSRSNQFIVALHDNERLGGGSPWEVPWGELVGKESYDTLDKIYTGYGENGPSQARLSREGSSEGVRQEFPNLDYILGCNVIDSR